MYLQDRANYYFTNYFLLKVGIIYNFLFVYKNAVLAVSNGCQTNILSSLCQVLSVHCDTKHRECRFVTTIE